MTGLKNIFISQGGITSEWGGNFGKFINRGSHWGVSHRSTWAGLLVVAKRFYLKKFKEAYTRKGRKNKEEMEGVYNGMLLI